MLFPVTIELNEAQIKRVINRISHLCDGMNWFYDYTEHKNKEVCLSYNDEDEMFFAVEGSWESPLKMTVMKEIDLPSKEVHHISNCHILGIPVEEPTFPFAEVMRAINDKKGYFTYCLWK